MKKLLTVFCSLCIMYANAQTPAKSGSVKTQDTTKNSKFSKKGYDSWKAQSNMGATSTVVNPLYEAPTTAGNNPLMGQNRPGTPIGGIIVKGGKNPGGQMMTLTTNEIGEITLNITEAGNYKFTIIAPAKNEEQTSNTPESRGWNGTVKGSSKVTGGPIGGIIVKGGKNPGGQMFTIISNEKGEIELKNLTVGNYKFSVTQPAINTSKKGINEAGMPSTNTAQPKKTKNE
ncbi:MAG: carboxypeptidase regulatory-like domain-containing protein [Pedobacter sp.]|nr:MAG: carboxypeptidase regulatory-like domain-containing protein [Pedobacter sp.]